MPCDANDFFQRLFRWRDDRDAGIKILAERADRETDGMVDAINDIVSARVSWKGRLVAVGPCFLTCYNTGLRP